MWPAQVRTQHWALLGTLLAGLSLNAPAARAADRTAYLTVSAATSLSAAFKDLTPIFEAANPGTRLRFNFGASGALLQQLSKGAPVDVLAVADVSTMNQAQAQGLVRAEQRRNFVSNSLVLVVPVASAPAAKTLAELMQANFKRIATGVPGSVPVGRYTQTALQAAGLWAAVEPKLVGAHSARQALDYVARGEVEAGFVYATDAAAMPAKIKVALTVPTPTPIVYPVAPVLSSAQSNLAGRFVDFLLSAPAQTVMAKHGFGKP